MRVMIKTTATVTARGTPLSIENSLAVENPPQVYDVYIDQNRGGPNVATIATGQPSWHGTAPMPLYIKGPVDVGKLVMEQNPGAKINNEDQVRIFVAENTGIYGSTRPNTELFSAEAINKAGINLGIPSDANWNAVRLAISNSLDTPVFKIVKSHSKGEHTNYNENILIDLKGCYGRFMANIFSLHSSNSNYRWVIYNADGSVVSDNTVISGGGEAKGDTRVFDITKGQYMRLIYSYTTGNISSKNNNFMTIGLYSLNSDISPALLISGAYFNNTNTVQLFNQGCISGFGGDSTYNAYQANFSDLWQAEAIPQTNETHPRKYTGGDGVAFCDLRQLIIQNSGLITGGGGAGGYKIDYGKNADNYRPGGGGAPNGRGGVLWDRYAANGGIGPIVYGGAGGLGRVGGSGTGGGPAGGNMGANGNGASLSTAIAGAALRGSPSIISYSSSGTITGFPMYT